MRIFVFTLVFVLFGGMVASLACAAELGAGCFNNQTVYLRARIWAEEIDDSWQGIVVKRIEMGVCRSAVLLEMDPLILDPGQPMIDAELFLPLPSPLLAYRYELHGLEAGGSTVPLTGSDYAMTWFNVHSCAEDAPIMRGALYDIGSPFRVGIDICADACWDACTTEATVGISDLDPSDYEHLLDSGTVVNIYGEFDLIQPPNDRGCVNAVHIMAVSGCDAEIVATEGTLWGSLKAKYR